MFRYNVFLFFFGLLKIPLLLFVRPKILLLDEEKCRFRIKLGYFTKNHLNSMYFGVLGIGAELSIAGAAVFAVEQLGQRVDIIFKDYSCEFLKRADGHVLFCCDEVKDVRKVIMDAAQSPDRIEKTLSGYAVLEKQPDVRLANYRLTLSVKNRSLKK
jgi:hypothetical protein